MPSEYSRNTVFSSTVFFGAGGIRMVVTDSARMMSGTAMLRIFTFRLYRNMRHQLRALGDLSRTRTMIPKTRVQMTTNFTQSI